jgi:hypothetical protein
MYVDHCFVFRYDWKLNQRAHIPYHVLSQPSQLSIIAIMECEEVEATAVRDDCQRFQQAFTAWENKEIEKLEAEEEKRRQLFAQRQKELNDYFEEQKQYKEETAKKLAEQRAKDLKEQQEVKEKLAIAEREKQLAEAESICANLTVLKIKHEGEQENRENLKKLVNNAFLQEQSKFLENMQKEKDDFDQYREGHSRSDTQHLYQD